MLWVALNFYLAERLSRVAEEVPVVNSIGEKEIVAQNEQSGNKPPSPGQHQSQGTYSFDKKQAEDALAAHGHDVIFQPLRAYVEKKLNDTVPGTIDKGNLDEKRPKIEVGKPGKFYVPLPLREGSPDDVS